MVKVYESEIEDYLVEHWGECLETEYWCFIGRQRAIPHGRLDLLFWEWGQLMVTELKTRPLEARDVCQVLRYQSDIREILPYSLTHYAAKVSVYAKEHYGGLALKTYMTEFQKSFLHIYDIAVEPMICPVLIGSSAPEEVLAAMDAISGRVYTWSREEDGAFSLEQQYRKIRPAPSDYCRAHPWTDKFYDAVHDGATEEANYEQDLLAYRLFGNCSLEHGADREG